jgi:putative peptide zinc metalloprotease protein
VRFELCILGGLLNHTQSSPTVSIKDRKLLIAGVPAFAGLADEAIEKIAPDFREDDYPARAVVMLQGHAGDRFAIIVSGRVEVSILDARQVPVTVAELGTGDWFGEMALLGEGHRSATVTALRPCHLLTIDATRFKQILAEVPEARNSFEQIAEQITLSNFLKLCTPFSGLQPAQVRELSHKVERTTVPAGAVIVKQGEMGSSCYLVRSGSVEVILESEGHERRMATLSRGSLFGEAALITEAPRNATVRAIDGTDLLVIRREDLLSAIGSDPKVAMRLFELLQIRGRPRQARGVEVHPRVTSDGSTIYYLKNPARGTYYKLTERGFFLWQQLSGSNGMRELVIAWFAEFKSFEPAAVAQILRGLAMAGFLHGVDLDVKAALSIIQLKWWQRFLLLANRLLDWRWTARNVDPVFERLYNGGVKFLFSRPSLAIMSLISLAGLVAFFFAAPRGKAALATDAHLKWLVLAAGLICTALHEAAHAFTTKHFGRHVNGMGLGWYRFGPVAFIDTSDMWLGGKWERLAVTAAGPIMNIILAGMASLAILASSNIIVIAGLWQFAVLAYLLVLLNLNPLLELDGYYLLMDWLERPNLRTKALRWLTREFPSAVGVPGALRAHRVELVYGIGTLIYVTLTSVAVAVSFHQFTKEWMARSVPGSEYLSYLFTAVLLCFFFARIAGDLRGRQG